MQEACLKRANRRHFSDASLNQFIGTGKDCCWNVETERLSGLAVDHELELGRLLHGEVDSFTTFQNTIGL
jgi:hypothetical protein